MTTLPQTEDFRKNVLKSALQEAIYAQLDFITSHPRVMEMNLNQLARFQSRLHDIINTLESDANFPGSKKLDSKYAPPQPTSDIKDHPDNQL